MWPRYMELMLGAWLSLSPFVFAHGDQRHLWVWDLASASVLIVAAILAHLERLRRIHLTLLLLAVALFARGWLHTRTDLHDPAAQNHIMVGLLLMMIAIIPSPASLPPGHRWVAVPTARRRAAGHAAAEDEAAARR